MKGVIVQIGEPKSIVLYNNGRIGAISTPANCHVGMVVTVQYNEKLKILLIAFAAVLLVSAGVFIGTYIAGDGADGRSGTGLSGEWRFPSGQERAASRGRQVQSVTVNQVKNLGDDSLVLLTGNIVESLGDKKYMFRDSTGDIVVEIENKIWRALSVDVSETVEISGEVDIERGRAVIEVKDIRKK